MKRLHWLDQLQYEARKVGIGPNRRSGAAPLWVPAGYREDPNFPRCERCNYAMLDRIQLEDEGKNWLEIRGWHHGDKDGEAFRIQFERRPTQDDIKRALRSAVFYRLEHIESA